MMEFGGFDNLRPALYKAYEFRYCAPERAVLIGGSAPKGKVPWGTNAPEQKLR